LALSESTSENDGYHFQGSWGKPIFDNWQFNLQLYADELNRKEANNIVVKKHDLSTKFIRLGGEHELAFGLGFRNQYSEFSFQPGGFNLKVPSDQLTLILSAPHVQYSIA
jgi:hypothetical protein